jgi:hypothetical protein
MKLQPTPSEERWLVLARRLRRGPRTAPFAEHTGGWRTATLWSRCAFFVLGLVAAVMISIIGSQLWPGAETLITGLVSLAAAEWLILVRRHFASGIEEALGVVGLTTLAYECWSRFSTSEPVGAAFLGIALAIAGFRLLSPVFTTLSALAFVLALDAPPLGASLTCYAIGLIALMAGGYRFRRPSHDLMLDYLVIVMPVAGYLWSASRHGLSIATDFRHAGLSEFLVPACSLVFAGTALAIGLRRRTHAPVIASMLCVACCAYELRKLTGLSLEARLIVWGFVVLLISMSLDRYLLVPRGGITSRRLHGGTDPIGILGIASSAVLTPHSPLPKPSSPFEGGGGRFGGGGAGGSY